MERPEKPSEDLPAKEENVKNSGTETKHQEPKQQPFKTSHSRTIATNRLKKFPQNLKLERPVAEDAMSSAAKRETEHNEPKQQPFKACDSRTIETNRLRKFSQNLKLEKPVAEDAMSSAAKSETEQLGIGVEAGVENEEKTGGETHHAEGAAEDLMTIVAKSETGQLGSGLKAGVENEVKTGGESHRAEGAAGHSGDKLTSDKGESSSGIR